ncbi:MAG: hypothetical protein KKD39_08100 [Candidatus Altiarchaeota archaeon]|nr:hypothetical protein [Candidatus Altiarchaeota archaeon]
MRIIPVLDVMGGIAVHAKKGDRSQYMPLETVVCSGCDPLKLAKAYEERGFEEIYIADLDAITGVRPNIKKINEIASNTNLKVMADIGLKRVPEYMVWDFSPIISSESLANISHVVNHEEYVFSIDTKGGSLISACGFSLGELTDWLRKTSFKDIIVLDLDIVGTNAGPNLELVKKISERIGRGVVYGCGIRDVKDIRKLKDADAEGVLVGSAIHSGKIGEKELHSI